jgi:hypothetical protein
MRARSVFTRELTRVTWPIAALGAFVLLFAPARADEQHVPSCESGPTLCKQSPDLVAPSRLLERAPRSERTPSGATSELRSSQLGLAIVVAAGRLDQPLIEGEGLGIADRKSAEVGMSRIQQEVVLSGNHR